MLKRLMAPIPLQLESYRPSLTLPYITAMILGVHDVFRTSLNYFCFWVAKLESVQ